jgi:hypothetical protein
MSDLPERIQEDLDLYTTAEIKAMIRRMEQVVAERQGGEDKGRMAREVQEGLEIWLRTRGDEYGHNTGERRAIADLREEVAEAADRQALPWQRLDVRAADQGRLR